ncbi:MAG: excinuclease ABC subunit UvrA [Succinivibrio sp.]|nr:excinuclease ABC subunit UvrA [Succinivibrio sp.]
MPKKNQPPQAMLVRGAHVHNLKNLNVDIPLHKLVGIAGVSGSGKSSLALGVLYAEGSRRYLESLSTYTRRRLTESTRANVDEVRYVPAALALHQRPGVPGIRSTFGTGSELLNSLRLMFSRLGCHRCPNGHLVPPSLAVAADKPLICPSCQAEFMGPSAEEFAFNSQGACPHCQGTGMVRTVDESTLIPDESLSIDEGAVAPWNSLMWSLMTDVCRAMGVRTDIPYRDLTAEEKEIVLHGPAEKKHIFYKAKNSNVAGELDFTYFNAVYTVQNALSKVKDESGMKRVEKFLKTVRCPECHGTRLSQKALGTQLLGLNLSQVCEMPLSELQKWVTKLPEELPAEMQPMAERICEAFFDTSKRLLELGLGYLSLDREAATLSTGERQRMQLARAVRNRTTGVLYVLDEPSIGLHPYNLKGLLGVMRDLLADGNSVVLVDHETLVLREVDELIELGPQAGDGGGQLIAQGTVSELIANPNSQIGPYLVPKPCSPAVQPVSELFDRGRIVLETGPLHTVKPLTLEIPQGRLTVVTGVSGSGKTTLVLESLIPALEARFKGEALPAHVRKLEAGSLERVQLIDATPIGSNIRSTVATYVEVHDELRKLYAKTEQAKALNLKASAFSYNTGSLRCRTCDGTGQISLDVQFLPDVDIPCPDCRGLRYAPEAFKVHYANGQGESYSLPELMNLEVRQARSFLSRLKKLDSRLCVLEELGLGYLKLGEQTPLLSGGEAQRLKLSFELHQNQANTLFVFDEPTIGLHPLDVKKLLEVFALLLEQGATLVVIEHDLDVIKHADYVVDLGPYGGEQGGRIVCAGTPQQVAAHKESLTGQYLIHECFCV